MAYSKEGELITGLHFDELWSNLDNWEWYWIDFQEPTNEEREQFQQLRFHPLAIKDCLHHLQRPKLDYYDDYHFLVLNTLHPKTLKTLEIDLFLHKKYLISFCFQSIPEINQLWNRCCQKQSPLHKGISYIFYKLFDKIVDSFFPLAQKLEDRLTNLETSPMASQLPHRMNELYFIRKDLLRLRHVVWPMCDLIYRIISSHHIANELELKRYLSDIQDHLHKLSSMIDSSRDIASDIRDNYISLNSYRMNAIMMRLTLIATIFMPLTFIVGIYGMNFENMPELKNPYGYFIILGVMGVIALLMYLDFRRKGWFTLD